MNFIVYVLRSGVHKKSYVGVTNDLTRRIGEHNSGKHFYTKRHVPWEIIRTEAFDSFRVAHEREKFLKSTSGRRFLKKLFEAL